MQPRSMTSGDISGDGLPDLVCGFSTPGGGWLSVQRANMESLYPRSAESYRRIREGTFRQAMR